MSVHKPNSAPLTITQSTCAYCGVGCGVDIQHRGDHTESLQGSKEHPANYGRLCIKGSKLLDTTGAEGRLLHPEIYGQRASWQQAIDTVADKFKQVIAEHGPDAVAFYVSGQLLTEDYYVANKLMKGYIGSANIDTNSRLCMSSAVAAYKRAFGEDVVPCDYSDLEQTDLLVLVGSNAAWTHPVLYQRMERAKLINPKLQVVVVDPRRTASCELADTFLQLKPGTDAALFNGLLHYMAANHYLDQAFIDQHTEQFSETLKEVQSWTLEKVAQYCRLTIDAVEHFYRQFCVSEKAVSFYSMGVNQSSSGTDKCNSIINCHLASGKILKAGCGPFSITGQPNAMGGREVGGLANQLTAHRDINNPQHRETVQRFWQSPVIADKPGYKAVDLFDAMAAGKIKALWVMATNPMVSLPDRNRIEQALERCEMVVVSDCVASNDTLAHAHIKLPATTWLEKDGTVTNSERRVSRQRSVVSALGEARADWQIICDVAKAMGFSGFNYQHPAQIFSEWTALTGYENQGLQLNLSAKSGLSIEHYNAMQPFQWPMDKHGNGQRPFADKHFSTASCKAQFVPVAPRLPQQLTSAEFPLVLNSGRLRDQWHSMTRTGKASALQVHSPKPVVMVHPFDAAELELQPDNIVRITTAVGKMLCYLAVSERVQKGECFVPIHWNRQFASSANVSALYQSVVDPLSGQPEFKQGAAALAPVEFAQYLQLFSRDDLTPDADFWVKQKIQQGTACELAFKQSLDDPLQWCQQNSGVRGEWITLSDAGGKRHIQCIQDGQLVFMAYVSAQPLSVDNAWAEHLLAQNVLSFAQIQDVLNASPGEEFLQGRQICSCFKVREKPIIEAIQAGAHSVEQLGRRLQCGSNCGSCKSELAGLIKEYAQPIHIKQLETE